MALGKCSLHLTALLLFRLLCSYMCVMCINICLCMLCRSLCLRTTRNAPHYTMLYTYAHIISPLVHFPHCYVPYVRQKKVHWDKGQVIRGIYTYTNSYAYVYACVYPYVCMHSFSLLALRTSWVERPWTLPSSDRSPHSSVRSPMLPIGEQNP